jgi:hypothetical protein
MEYEDLSLFERGFYRLGKMSARRPLVVNGVCFVATVLCALGIMR